MHTFTDKTSLANLTTEELQNLIHRKRLQDTVPADDWQCACGKAKPLIAGRTLHGTMTNSYPPRCGECDPDTALVAEVLFERNGQAEIEQRIVEARDYRREQIGPRHVNCEFDNYHPQHASQATAAGLLRGPWWQKYDTVTLCGRPGTGKTHLAAASFQQAQMNAGTWDLWPCFLSETEFLQDWRDAAARKGKFEIDRFKNCWLLYIDDLGTSRYTDGSLDLLYQLIDFRYRNNLKTLITTNYSLAALEGRIGEKIVSRIADRQAGRVLMLEGEDFRILGQAA